MTRRIEGGRATDSGVIYAVRCKKHELISVGYTTTPLNERMNRHRYDIANRPEVCELTQHFAQNGCDFTKDVEISILKHVTGSTDRMELEEDKWISYLNTKAPLGMNERLSEYGYFS